MDSESSMSEAPSARDSDLVALGGESLRNQFPILARSVRDGKPLIYLDSGATSQKPKRVLDAERYFYETHNAAVHRGAHQLAEEATDSYESARAKISQFVGGESRELIFTKNATESLNLVAYSFLNATIEARSNAGSSSANPFVLNPGDEIVISEMEHHANVIPWQQLAEKTGAVLRWFEIDLEGRLLINDIDELINDKTRIVSIVHQSNLLGTINPISLIAKRAHEVGAIVVLDACQSVPHMSIDVHQLDVDFMAWSGHKMYGPMGIGCLWGRYELLEQMPPFITGGSMIKKVTMDGSTFADPPQRFEAGVPMAAQAAGLAEAVDFLSEIGMENVANYESTLTLHALEVLSRIDGVRIIGPVDNTERGGAVSFVVDDVHSHDVGQVLDDAGIAVRVGHHCAAPTCQRFNVSSTVRASFGIYNTLDDIDRLGEAVIAAQRFFGVGGAS